MKRQNKKGFTLVELLVVIAILAILATVSVVGYTAFIKRATVSNDENVAAQLNQFLTAMKADSTGKYYNAEINENNIHEVTEFILQDSGLGKLEPQALKYEYHFWFDLESGKYVVAKEKNVSTTSPLVNILNGISVKAEGEGEGEGEAPQYKKVPGNCFTDDYRYFLVDTDGSLLANVVRGFYTLDKYEEDESSEKGIVSFLKDIKGLDISALYDLAEKTVFVTKDGNYVLKQAETNMWGDFQHSRLTIYSNAIYVDCYNKTINGSSQKVVDLITVSEDTDIYLPKGVMVPTGGLNIAAAEGVTVTIHIDIDDWNDPIGEENKAIKEILDNSFTGANVIIKINGSDTEYRIGTTGDNTGDIVTIDSEGENFIYKLGDGSNFPLESFDIKIAAVDGKVVNLSGGKGYVAIDNKVEYGSVVTNGFELVLDNINNGEKPASNTDVTYTIDKIEVNKETITKNIRNYVVVDGSSFNIKSTNVDTITIIGKSGDVTNTITVHVVRPETVTSLKLTDTEGNSYTANSENGNYVFSNVQNGLISTVKGEENKTQDIVVNSKFTLSATVETNVTVDSITLDGFDFEFTSNEYLDFGVNGKNTFALKDGTTSASQVEVSYTLGDGLISEKFTISLVDKYNVTALASQIRYVGDENQILTAGDLINLVPGKTIPAGSKLFVGKAAGTTLYSYNQTFDPANENQFLPSSKLVGNSNAGLDIDKDWNEKKLEFNALGDNETEAKLYVFIAEPQVDGKYKIISSVSNIILVDGYNFKSDNDNNDIFHIDAGTGEGNAKPTGKCAANCKGNDHVDGCENVEYNILTNSDTDRIASVWAKYKNDITNTKYHAKTNKNIVLLADYELSQNAYLTLGEGYTFYGNLFELNLRNARNNGEGVIELTQNATLRDVKVLGQAYGEENDPYVSTNVLTSNTDDGFYNYTNGTAASVRIMGTGVLIDNCYISGGRAPVRVQAKNATIKDTVLFGGAYSNLDIQNGSIVTLENIVTVSEYVNGDISGDISADGKGNFNNKLCPAIVVSGDKQDTSDESTVHIYIEGTFEQYNYVSTSQSNSMANSKISTIYKAMDTAGQVNENANATSFVFEYNGARYYNIGIFWLDRINFGTDGDNYKINVHYKNTYLPPHYASRIFNVGYKATYAARYNEEAADIESYLKMGEYYMPTRIDTPNHFKMTYEDQR